MGLSTGDSACFESLGKRLEAGQSYGKAGRHLQAVTVAQAGSDVACARGPRKWGRAWQLHQLRNLSAGDVAWRQQETTSQSARACVARLGPR